MTTHHLTTTARRGAALLVVLAAIGSPASARGQSPPSDRLSAAVEQVGQATAVRFGARDRSGARLPAGRPALLVTMFVFSEGAGAGEAGPLIYYREL